MSTDAQAGVQAEARHAATPCSHAASSSWPTPWSTTTTSSTCSTGWSTDCVELLDVTAAGLLLADQRGDLQLMASSSEETRPAGAVPAADRRGPLPRVLPHRRPRWPSRTCAEPRHRWPRFAAAAAGGGLHVGRTRSRCGCATRPSARSTCSAPQPRPIDDDGPCSIAQALADVATIGILQQRASTGASARRRAAADRAQQPHRHRAGQGRARRARSRGHADGLRGPAVLRPQVEPEDRSRRGRAGAAGARAGRGPHPPEVRLSPCRTRPS